jgi:hypothetical protein
MSLPAALATSTGDDQRLWIAIAGAGAVLLYLLMRPRAKKRDPLDATPRFPLGKQREVENQMNNVLVELARMAREITAQLDTRAVKLELLIKEADQKLAALHAAASPVQITAEVNNSPPPENVIAEEEAEALQTFSDQPAARVERYGEIYALADEGKPANEIGRILQRPTGEIELILALRRK